MGTQFPSELEAPCIRVVHHSLLKLDDLVSALYEQQHTLLGGGKEGGEAAAEAAGASPGAGGKKALFTKVALKRWIQEVGRTEGWGRDWGGQGGLRDGAGTGEDRGY